MTDGEDGMRRLFPGEWKCVYMGRSREELKEGMMERCERLKGERWNSQAPVFDRHEVPGGTILTVRDPPDEL